MTHHTGCDTVCENGWFFQDELELSEKERKKLKKIKSTAEDSDEEEEGGPQSKF